MDYLGDKLTVAQTHMTQWMGTVRRSLQEALNLVTTAVAHERSGGDGGSRTPFKRTSSFRHFASRSRESFRRFSVRSQQRFSSLRKRQPSSEPPELEQLRQCFSRQAPGAKDTDTLVQEPDGRYGTWSEQRRSGDSFVPECPSLASDAAAQRQQQQQQQQQQPPGGRPAEQPWLAEHGERGRDRRSASLDRGSADRDSTDGAELPPSAGASPDGSADFSFIDHTAVLDSSALKTRVQLSKKRRRRNPTSHSLRRSRGLEFENRFSLVEEPDNAWMFKDSTEEKNTMQQEDSEEEDKIQHTPKSSSVQAQRLPVFPGMDHSALKAQLRKRQESESAGDAPCAQLFKSPKGQLGPPGSRVLPSSLEREDRSEEKSPQWLKELKSKKRQSHYENQV